MPGFCRLACITSGSPRLFSASSLGSCSSTSLNGGDGRMVLGQCGGVGDTLCRQRFLGCRPENAVRSQLRLTRQEPAVSGRYPATCAVAQARIPDNPAEHRACTQNGTGPGNIAYINIASKRLRLLKESATRMRLPFRDRVGAARANMLRSATTTLEVNNWSGTSISEMCPKGVCITT